MHTYLDYINIHAGILRGTLTGISERKSRHRTRYAENDVPRKYMYVYKYTYMYIYIYIYMYINI